MITSNMTGNLGNHMFIYALTRTVAEHNGYEWGFNPSTEFDYHQGKPQMDFMEIDYGKTHSYKYNETPPWIDHEWREEYNHFKLAHDTYDFHPYQKDVFDIEDNTKLFIRCAQDARYYDKEKVKQWFKVKEENKGIYKAQLREFGIDIESNDVCIINIRGGEYKGIANLILRKDYWQDSIQIMKERNPKMRFLCISDDVGYANQILDFKVPVTHLSIGGDYYVINKAKNLILSNSSFAIFPTWLNENNPFVIAPRYWARHNTDVRQWVSSDIWTFGWNFLDKDGILYND
jgi:hypothetical protein